MVHRRRLLLLTLRFIRADDVTNGRTTKWAGATVDSTTPVLHRTLIAHAHVTAHVKHRVDGVFVADCAVDTARWIIGAVVGDRSVNSSVGVHKGRVLLLFRHRRIQRRGAFR